MWHQRIEDCWFGMAANLWWCWEWIVLLSLVVSRRPWVEDSLSSFSNWSDQSCI